MVGLPLQGSAVSKKPPSGVGAISTGNKVDVAVGPTEPAGVLVAVGSGVFPPADGVFVGGGVGVRVGIVCAERVRWITAVLNITRDSIARNRQNLTISIFRFIFTS